MVLQYQLLHLSGNYGYHGDLFVMFTFYDTDKAPWHWFPEFSRFHSHVFKYTGYICSESFILITTGVIIAMQCAYDKPKTNHLTQYTRTCS